MPPNCTVVGIPGKIVKCEGEKQVKVAIENLPDSLLDTLNDIYASLNKLEHRIDTLEKELKNK